jgi:hypothetical protein
MIRCPECGTENKDGGAFCTKCGRSLKLESPKSTGYYKKDYYERDRLIYPDCIVSTADSEYPEIPIKQYNLVKMRTWYKSEKAEGRLQITNKRILFRATGKSPYGKTVVQSEFNIAEIGGIEIRKGTVFSVGYFLLCLIPFINTLMFFGFIPLSGIIDVFYTLTQNRSVINDELFNELAIVIMVFSLSPLKFKHNQLLKMVFAFVAMAMASGVLFWVAAVVTLITIVAFASRQTIAFVIKSKGATTGIDIRRSSSKEHQEFTGFNEVTPWEDSEAAISELGAIINDIQVDANGAIERWRE